MALAEATFVPSPAPGTAPDYGYIGKIPVRNIWLLMLYASEYCKISDKDLVANEAADEDFPRILAEILAGEVEKRQRRRLNHSYRTRTAVLNRVRGRIDMLKTERRQLLARGLVACRFDELTIDTPRNRFVRAALEKAARLVQPRHTGLAHHCRSLAHQMTAMGVAAPAPDLREINAERFGLHDADDRIMTASAKLIFEMAIPTEESGSNALPLPNREEVWVRKLFERAIGGFYSVVLSRNEWNVETGKRLKWKIAEKSDGMEDILPSMKTDIILNQRKSNRRIVIDTKFTSVLGPGWHRDATLHNGHIYQIYAYLRSQEGTDTDTAADGADGVLLHPSTGEDVDQFVVIQNHRIRFMTVDLRASTKEIRAQLMKVIDLK